MFEIQINAQNKMKTSKAQRAIQSLQGKNKRVWTIAIVSADNPMDAKPNSEHDDEETLRLFRSLTSGHVIYVPTLGVYGRLPINPTFVFNITLHYAKSLANAYKQQSMTFIDITSPDHISYQLWERPAVRKQLRLVKELCDTTSTKTDDKNYAKICRRFNFCIPFFEGYIRTLTALNECPLQEEEIDRMLIEITTSGWSGWHKYVTSGKLYGKWYRKWSNNMNVDYQYELSEISRQMFPEITLPEGFTTIAHRAFFGNKYLTKVFIPKSVTLIEDDVFRWCKLLTHIVVADDNPVYCSVDGVLYSKDMTTLVCCPAAAPFSSYVIPESVTTIRPYAFWYCHHLTRVTISRNVVSIGEDAFMACPSLTHVDYLAAACKKAGERFSGIFSGDCLTTINIGEDVERLPACLFSGCRSLKEIAIPESVIQIGRYAFARCSSLERISLPSSISKVADSMFSECENLETIYLPESIVSIGGYAFFKCTKLKTISLPQTLTSIGSDCFAYCWRLKSIVSLSPTPPKVDEYFFEVIGCDGEEETDKFYSCTLYVPKGCVKAYASADEWCEFENIEEVE